MYNIETHVSEPIGGTNVTPIVGPNTPFEWERFGNKSRNSRTDNSQMQTFAIEATSIGNGNTSFGLTRRAMTNSRQARTEIQVDGQFLSNHNGLQWYLVRCDYDTKERITGSTYGGAHYSYHSGSELDGEIWNDTNIYGPRKDFNAGTRYYLIGIDPTVVYASDCYTAASGRSWGFVTAISKYGTTKSKNQGAILGLAKENHGRAAIHITVLQGLDLIRCSQIWNDNAFVDSEAPSTKSSTEKWITNKFNRDLKNISLKKSEKELASTLDYDKPQVLYKKQFNNAEEILHVGHLRFRRVADANLQKSGSTVIDLIEWYGIIPILNVPKTVSFACSAEYFKHHPNSARFIETPNAGVLGCTNCTLDNLELPSGRYVIDIDSECLFGKNDYRYAYTKKGWILSSLANMTVEIDNDTVDRIMPIDHDGLIVKDVVVEDDDFLNRF